MPNKRIHKKIRWMELILGLFLLYFGIGLINNPVWISKYGLRFDVSDYQIPFAFSMISAGIYSFWIALTTPRSHVEGATLMCPQCNQPIERKQTKGNKCPTCDVELEPLEGFYDRHPELKGK